MARRHIQRPVQLLVPLKIYKEKNDDNNTINKEDVKVRPRRIAAVTGELRRRLNEYL